MYFHGQSTLTECLCKRGLNSLGNTHTHKHIHTNTHTHTHHSSSLHGFHGNFLLQALVWRSDLSAPYLQPHRDSLNWIGLNCSVEFQGERAGWLNIWRQTVRENGPSYRFDFLWWFWTGMNHSVLFNGPALPTKNVSQRQSYVRQLNVMDQELCFWSCLLYPYDLWVTPSL